MSKALTLNPTSVFFILLFSICGCGEKKPTTDNLNIIVTVPTYDTNATVFSLVWLSNISGYMMQTPDSLQSHTTHGVNAVLSNPTVIGLIGQWKPVWGPVNYTADTTVIDSCVADNTMMLVYGPVPGSPSDSMYVLAIAGTNGPSIYDWEDEDFSVDTMALWPNLPDANPTYMQYFGSPSLTNSSSVTQLGNYIAKGACTGMNILMNIMKDPQTGQTLVQYLNGEFGNSSTSTQIAVAGHSLGGTLAPVVALALVNNQGYWNPSKSVNITAYPFAGSSPGNQGFQTCFANAFNATNFFGYYNLRDVVPHTLQANMLTAIPALYDTLAPQLSNQCLLTGIVNCVNIKKVSKFNYTTLYSPANGFAGAYTLNGFPSVSSLISLYDTMSTQNNFNDECVLYGCYDYKDSLFARTTLFGIMALQQHVDAYIEKFGITEFDSIYSLQLFNDAPSVISEILNIPLIHYCTNPHL